MWALSPHDGDPSTSQVAVVLEGWGTKTRESQGQSKRSRRTLFLLKPAGRPHRGRGHWIQSAEGLVTDREHPGLGDSTDPHPTELAQDPVVTLPWGAGARKFPSFSKSHCLS